MKITDVRTRPLKLPYKNPLKTAANYFDVATGVLVEIATDEGTRGYGYADVFPRAGETIATAQALIHEVIAPGVIGKSPMEAQLIVEWMEKNLLGNFRAKAAVEMGIQDLRGKATGLPLYELLGGAVRKSVLVMPMIGLQSPERMAEEAETLVDQGIKALKLKIGTGLKEDVQRVQRVRQRVGKEIFIKVDANQAYTVPEALRVARHLEEFEVESFEQPVAAHDWEGMVHLNQNSPIPIEADQTVRTVNDALRAIRLGAAQIITTSPQKAGGILQAKRVADLCQVAGIQCIVSNVAGSLINDAAAIHLIAASVSTTLPCEVGQFERVSGDPARGLIVQDGEIHVPSGPGLGIEVQFPVQS
ncbi:MAG: mandelate racemase/muconate lactonizing enzyme family protein [Deltaproteobacteria bacterium]|nr:mandelate racemase/muconate lactonizing enzyme family protein [Deltaproteobacteria bacterium]